MAGLFKPLYFEPLRHLYRLAVNPSYRSCCLLEERLGRTPRFTPRRVTLDRLKLEIPDAASFLSMYRELFVDEIYAFPFQGGSPAILDLGANIGLSVIYFKKRFPDARITAVEADPAIFACLRNNVEGNGFKDIRLLNKAAWHENGRLRFRPEGADGGRTTDEDSRGVIEVEAVDVRDLLRRERFDLLKMDIEGGEERVFPACEEYLSGVSYVFIEYHSAIGRRQCLDNILAILTRNGFRTALHNLQPCRSPFMGITPQGGFDMQLNLFAWKDGAPRP